MRTRVHEYGGGAWSLAGPDLVLFANFADQRLYRQRLGEAPVAITPEPETGAGLRYADFRLTPDGETVVCVREVHGEGEAENQIVSLPLDGEAPPTVLASGRDFYSFPRLSPDGLWLAWTCWDHPNMPWDGTELWLAPFDNPGDGAPARRRPRGVDLPARVGRRRQPPLRLRPRRLVEPLPGRGGGAADRRRSRPRRTRSGSSAAPPTPSSPTAGRLRALRAGRRTALRPRPRRRAPARPRPPLHLLRLPLALRPRHQARLRRRRPRERDRDRPLRRRQRRAGDGADLERARRSTRPTSRSRGRSSSRPAAARPRTASTTRPPTPTSPGRRANGRR